MSLSRRDFLRLSSTAFLVSAFRSLSFPSTEALVPHVIYHGTRRLPRVALTFDDCWHPEVLEQLMAMLEPYPGFHFTFFAVGDAIDINEARKPGLWKRMHEQGHEIGYHTYHHYDPQTMSTAGLVDDFDYWMSTLERVLGIVPRVHFARPPGDELSLSFQDLCRLRGLVATMFSTGYEGSEMADSMRLVSRTLNGDIVQMHTYQDPERGRFDVNITAKAVPYLAEHGFSLVTMSELYDDLLREQFSASGCDTGTGSPLTRTCLE